MFHLNIYPQQWKTTTIAVLRKPNKPDYTIAKAYRPITLMESLAKQLSGCVAEILSYQAEKHNLLPKTNFGRHPGRSTTDVLHLTVKFNLINGEKVTQFLLYF